MGGLRFLGAILQRWWALMSCALFTFVALFVEWKNKSNDWTFRATLALGVMLFLVSCFLAWRDEYKKRIALEISLADITALANTQSAVPHVDVHVSQSNSAMLNSRPQIAMRAFQPTLDAMRGMSLQGAPFPDVEFRLRHLSGRPATSINVSDIASLGGNFSIRFDLLSFLTINGDEKVGFEVRKSQGITSRKAIALSGRTHLLQDFVWDSRNGDETVDFPFTVWFRDGVEQMSLHLRLLYSFSTRKFDVVDDWPPLTTYYENLEKI